MRTEFTGRCHCGAIGFVYRTSIEPALWSVRACQCSFCRAHDALSTSDPGGTLEFTATDRSRLNRYRFGLRTADFLLCKNCGVYIGAVIESKRGQFGIINIHALVDAPKDIAPVAPISYDTEDVNQRISRRDERWTPASMRL